jgi:quercetin dioxygenase-like cupin family protein
MKYSYPHTIDNGHGEKLTFLSFIEDADGGKLEVENHVQPGAGPPMHIHMVQDESLTVIQGKIGAQVAGEEPTFHGPGETVTFLRGVAHRFWNAGDDVLICRGWAKPAYNLEYFLTQIYTSTKENGGRGPSIFDGAYLQTKYASEFELVTIPMFVKKFIFPIVVFIGQITGKYSKFEGAPQPVTAG